MRWCRRGHQFARPLKLLQSRGVFPKPSQYDAIVETVISIFRTELHGLLDMALGFGQRRVHSIDHSQHELRFAEVRVHLQRNMKMLRCPVIILLEIVMISQSEEAQSNRINGPR